MLTTQFVPAAGASSRRLMIVLHGLGDTLEGWLWLPSALQLPWLNFLLVNAPEPYYGGYSWFDVDSGAGIAESREFLSNCWTDLRNFPPGRLCFPVFRRDASCPSKLGAISRQFGGDRGHQRLRARAGEVDPGTVAGGAEAAVSPHARHGGHASAD